MSQMKVPLATCFTLHNKGPVMCEPYVTLEVSVRIYHHYYCISQVSDLNQLKRPEALLILQSVEMNIYALIFM